MFTEMDHQLARQRREELAREIASWRLGRKLRAGRWSFRPPHRAEASSESPTGGRLQTGEI